MGDVDIVGVPLSVIHSIVFPSLLLLLLISLKFYFRYQNNFKDN